MTVAVWTVVYSTVGTDFDDKQNNSVVCVENDSVGENNSHTDRRRRMHKKDTNHSVSNRERATQYLKTAGLAFLRQ